MTVTRELVVELQKHCSDISESGRAFFAQASNESEGGLYTSSVREMISPETLERAERVRAEVIDFTARLIEAAKSSPLIGREDISDATTAMKTALAALRFKDYQRWDTHVLSDEDRVLGVRQAGQMEQDTNLKTALRGFVDAMQRLTDIAALLVPGQPMTIVGEDDRFARMAVDEARKSTPEDARAHPLVGAVVVKDGRVLATAHRGEIAANHAEYIALETKLNNVSITGGTVYTTLEPCTTRKHPKIPCADRLIERKVTRVVIGMLDPNPDIRGRGMWKLQQANIAVEMFPHELTKEIHELNRQFIRSCLDSDKAGMDRPKDRQLVLKKRKLFNLLRGIDCIECDFRFPPGPTGACFNVGVIRQINADIDGIQNALVELMDLPEARQLVVARIPMPPTTDASWSWLEATFREHFLPIQRLFSTLKAEVLEQTDLTTSEP
jgi:pyrimidine deaminase RibD-like protein